MNWTGGAEQRFERQTTENEQNFESVHEYNLT